MLQEEDSMVLEELALMSGSYLKHGDVAHAESACPFECWTERLQVVPTWAALRMKASNRQT